MLRYAATMLVAGIGIPVLAALNARLGARTGSPAAAATMLLAVALAGAALTMLAMRGQGAPGAAPGQPKYLFAAGLLAAFDRSGSPGRRPASARQRHHVRAARPTRLGGGDHHWGCRARWSGP